MNAVLIQIILSLVGFIMSNPSIPQDVKDQAMQLVNENAKALRTEQVETVAPVTYSAPVETGTTTENVVSYTATTTMETEQFVFVKKSPEIGLGVLPNGNVGTKFVEVRWIEPNGKEYVSWVSRTDDYQPFGFVSGVSYTLTGYKDTKMVDKKAVGVGKTGSLIGVME